MFNVVRKGDKNYLMLGRDEHYRVKNSSYLAVASSGYGKTVLSEKIIEDFYRRGYKIISIFDMKDDLEGAFISFPPIHKKHIESLKEQGLWDDANNKVKREDYIVRINHPLTKAPRKIPHKKIPETNFFTIPLKSLSEDDIMFLLEAEEENESVTLFQNMIDLLKPSDSLYHFTFKMGLAREREEKKIKRKGLVKSGFDSLKEGSLGRKDRADRIDNILKKFENDGYLVPEDYPLNIDIRKMMYDRKVIDVFSERYLTTIKEKMFIGFYLLDKIHRELPTCRVPILIQFQELTLICPAFPKGHYKMLADKISIMLRKSRSLNCSFVGDTQQTALVTSKVISGFTEKAFGRVTASAEISNYAKNEKMTSSQIELIKRCPVGYFYIGGHINKGRVKVDMPTHLHSEEDLIFDDVYSDIFPSMMKNYDEMVLKLRKDNSVWLKDAHQMKKEQGEFRIAQKIEKEKEEEMKDKKKLVELTEQDKLQKKLKKSGEEETKKRISQKRNDDGSYPPIIKVIKTLKKLNISISKESVKKYRAMNIVVEDKEESVEEDSIEDEDDSLGGKWE